MSPRGVFMHPSQCFFSRIVFFFIVHDTHMGRDMIELNHLLECLTCPLQRTTDQHWLGVYLLLSNHGPLLYWITYAYEILVVDVNNKFLLFDKYSQLILPHWEDHCGQFIPIHRLFPPWSGTHIVRWFLTTPNPIDRLPQSVSFTSNPHVDRQVTHHLGLTSAMFYVPTILPVAVRAC